MGWFKDDFKHGLVRVMWDKAQHEAPGDQQIWWENDKPKRHKRKVRSYDPIRDRIAITKFDEDKYTKKIEVQDK